MPFVLQTSTYVDKNLAVQIDYNLNAPADAGSKHPIIPGFDREQLFLTTSTTFSNIFGAGFLRHSDGFKCQLSNSNHPNVWRKPNCNKGQTLL